MFRVEEEGQFRGAVTLLSVNLPAGSVADATVASAAGIAASKLEHQHRLIYSQESDTTAASEDRVIHVVEGATGDIQSIKAGSVVANIGAATITVDLHKNGASILTAPISLDSGDSAYDVVDGVVDTATLAVDDVLEIVVVATAGGGTLGKGVFASVDLFEDAA